MDSRVDLSARKSHQSLGGEFFHREASHRGSKHHCTTHVRFTQVTGAREISNEAAGERVACPSGVEHILERERGREENTFAVEHERAVLSLLDDDMLRAAVHYPFCCLHEVHFLGQLPRLTIVQRNEIHLLEKLYEIRSPALNPEVHRVAGNELWLLYLIENVELQARIDVPQEYEWSIPELRRNLRAEARKNSEMCFQRLCCIEIVPVPSAPAERGAVGALETCQVDAARRERLELLNWIIRPHNTHELNGRQETCSGREECRRTSEHIFCFSE